MTEIRNEIMAEVTKIYKTRFTHKIENFPNKLNEVSCFIVEIPGLAKWYDTLKLAQHSVFIHCFF